MGGRPSDGEAHGAASASARPASGTLLAVPQIGPPAMDRPTVLHSVRVWLPPTMTWLEAQVRHVHPHAPSLVACSDREGPGGAKAKVVQTAVPILTPIRLHRLARHGWSRPWRGNPHRRAVRRAALARLARRRGAHVLHSHFGQVGWDDMPVARKLRLGHAASFYGQDLTRLPKQDPLWAERYRELLASGATILCEGPHMAGVARGFGAGDVRIHHLGIEVDRIAFRPRAWPPEGTRPEKARPLRVLMAASFREKKGIPDGLHALAQVASEMPIEATLVGEPDRASGQDEAARIDAALRQPALAGRVRRLGYQPHARLLELAYEHDVFLSPSRTAADGDTEGGAPIGLLEMAATGMAIVATTHCDIPHVLPPSYRPHLVPEGDVDAIAASLRRWADRAGAWTPLLQEARLHLEREFDARVQGERLAAIYRELADGAGGPA
jgi:colanic acid/amylovoran biosynthesis glycosyltransferase